MQTKIYVTNGDLGTDNTWIVRYNLNSWQGRNALKRAVHQLEAQTGKPAWALTGYGREETVIPWTVSLGIPLA